jgi:hypothetical protein
MPRAFHQVKRRVLPRLHLHHGWHDAATAVHLLAVLLLAAVLTATPVHVAQAAEAVLTVNLDAGKHKAVRMRNLPKDAVMAIAAQSTGRIAVILLNERDYRTFPKVAEPVFAGTLERTLSFQVIIPEAGNYYLVLDNRRAGEVRKVRLGIRAQRGRAAPQPDVPYAPDIDPGGAERRQGT